MSGKSGTFDIVIVAQAGRLTYEAVLFVASLRTFAPNFDGHVYVAEPQPGPQWPRDPRINDLEAKGLMLRLGAQIVPFENKHFGASYPNGNKVEALAALPEARPFVFFDTDTIITGPIDEVAFDFAYPSASMARENTWPNPPLYGPGYDQIWRAVYEHFDVPFEQTLDVSEPDEHWRRYLYFNAGWFYHACPQTFAQSMIEIMTGIRDGELPELASQSFNPWLDQIALPVAITRHGGGRPPPALEGLDGEVSVHWRALPLFYAKATDTQISMFDEIVRPNRIKKVLKAYEPFRRMIYHGRGDKVRALFDQNHLPIREKIIRNRIKRERLWMR
ncbi:MAG: hypothetical protein HKN27_01280 [Silicimonas sp.]|nr:hypothetical protein [Silicimonas sp.]